MEKNAIAIITARGGSKRIPKKNIRPFCGKSIIYYSIKAALDSHIFDTVMVSTDDEQIAVFSKSMGAEVPFMRSERTSDDYSTTEDVIDEVLYEYQIRGVDYKFICNIYPTAPFISVDKLQEAFRILLNEECDSVFPVVQFSFPPQRGLIIKNNHLYPLSEVDYQKRSQDLEPVFHDSGQFYFFKAEMFKRCHSVVTNSMPIIVDELEVQDIDDETDWEIAEIKYNYFRLKNCLKEEL